MKITEAATKVIISSPSFYRTEVYTKGEDNLWKEQTAPARLVRNTESMQRLVNHDLKHGRKVEVIE